MRSNFFPPLVQENTQWVGMEIEKQVVSWLKICHETKTIFRARCGQSFLVMEKRVINKEHYY